MERKNADYRALLAEMTAADLLPGAREFLEAARAAGIKVGLASASRNAPDVIASLGIASLFDVLGDGHAVARSKPAPDLFVWVAGAFGLPVSACVVFEDAEAGVEGALVAGMACVGIGPAERVGRATLICDGLHAITVGQAAALVAGAG